MTWIANHERVDPKRCCERVHDGGRSVSFHQCNSLWKVERDGKKYCNRHDPAKIAEKSEAKRQEWERSWEERERLEECSAKLQASVDEVLVAAEAWADAEVDDQKAADVLVMKIIALRQLRSAGRG